MSIDVIEDLRRILSSFPNLEAETGASSITVPPISPNGFRVTLSVAKSDYEVAFASWHESFDDEEEAVRCFLFGLSEGCRLKVVSCGSFDYKWIVEGLYGDDWIEDSGTGLFIFPFWRKRGVRYLQNHLDFAQASANAPGSGG